MKEAPEQQQIDPKAVAREQKRKKAWHNFAGTLLLVQFLASLYAFYRAYRLGMIPERILYLAGGLYIFLMLLTTILSFAGKIPGAARNIRRFIAVILAIAVTIGSLYAGNFMGAVSKAVNNITSPDGSDIAAVENVYVLMSDPAQSLADCKDYKFGVIGDSEGALSYAAANQINKTTGAIDVIPYSSSAELTDALYSGSVRAMVIQDNYVLMLEETEEYRDFESRTRLIGSITVTSEELNTAKDANPFPSGSGSDADIGQSTDSVRNISTDPFIVYISGSDTRDKKFKVSRSDVNILMVVNPKTKQILLLNTPRDYFIPIPKSSSGKKDKLTHFGLYGVNCSIKGLENLYGCNINYYVQINFTGTEKLVDDLGGITINNPQAFSSRGYSFAKGDITINGAQAVVYARERYAFKDGDNMRGRNQMRIISAMIRKMTSSPKLIMNYSKILGDLEGFMVTSLKADEIDTLVKMQLNDMASWNIKTYSVTGNGGMDYTYSMPKTKLYVTYPNANSVDKASGLINKVISSGELTDSDVK